MGAKSTVRWASLVRRPSSIVRRRGSRLTCTMWILLLLVILLSQLPESSPSLIEEPYSMITKGLIHSKSKDAEKIGSESPDLNDVVKVQSTKQFSLYNDNENISVKNSSTNLLTEFDTGLSAAVDSKSVNGVFLNGRKLTKNIVKTLNYLSDNTVQVYDSGPLTAQKNKNSSEQLSYLENNKSLSRNIYPSKIFFGTADAKDKSRRLGKESESTNQKLSQIRNFSLSEQQNTPMKRSYHNMIDVIRSNRRGQKNGPFLITGFLPTIHAINGSTSNVFHTTTVSEEIDEGQLKDIYKSINNVEETIAGVEEIVTLTKPEQNDHDDRERLRATTTFPVTNYRVEHDIIDFGLNTRENESPLITTSSNKELMLSYHLQTDSFSPETTTFKNVDSQKNKASQLFEAIEQLNHFDSVQFAISSTESQYLSRGEAAPQQTTTTSSLNAVDNINSELVHDKTVKTNIIKTAPNDALNGTLNDTRPVRAHIGKTNSSLSKIIRAIMPLNILQSVLNYKVIEKCFTSSNITKHTYQFMYGDESSNHTASLSNNDNSSSDNITSAVYSKKMDNVTDVREFHGSDFLSVNTSTENVQNSNSGLSQEPKTIENFQEELVASYVINSSVGISESIFLNVETDSPSPLSTSTNFVTFDTLFVDNVSNSSEETLQNYTSLWNSSKTILTSNTTRTFIPVNARKQVSSTENTKSSSTTPDLTKIATFKSVTLTQDNSSNVIRIFGLLRITRGIQWTPELTKKYTKEYIQLSLILKELIKGVFIQSSLGNRLIEVEINKLSRGSIVVEFFLLLMEATSHEEVQVLSEVFLKGLGMNSRLGKFTVDPWFTKFDVVSIRRPTPKTKTTKDLPIPQWIIAVIVIASASLIFIVLFGAVAIYGRHHVRRRYGSRLQDEEEEEIRVSGYKEWESKIAVGYENMAADDNHYNGEVA